MRGLDQMSLIDEYVRIFREPGSVFLLGSTAEQHLSIWGGMSFSQAMAKVKGGSLAKVLILKQNLKSLPSIVRLVQDNGAKRVQLIFPEPMKGFEREYGESVPSVKDAVEPIDEARRLLKIELVPNSIPYHYAKPSDLITYYTGIVPSFDKGARPVKASVVVLTHDRKDYLLRTLSALENQSFMDFEVIIVDDDSHDGSLEAVDKLDLIYPLRYLYWQREKPFVPGTPYNRAGPARNLGTSFTQSGYLIFIDSDILPNQQFVQEHLSGSEHTVIIGLSVREREGRDIREEHLRLCDDDIMRLPVPWAMCHSGNFSLSKALFDEVGGFSDEFVYWGMEDDELGYRLQQKNATFKLNRRAFGTHLYHDPEYIDAGTREYGDRYHAEVFYKKHLDKAIYDYHIDKAASDGSHIAVHLGSACNNNCVFCEFLGEKRGRRQDMDRLPAKGRYVLMGGEPTLSPDFFESIRRIQGSETELVTNGRVFAYPGFADRVLKAGIRKFRILICGRDEKTHDALVGVPGAFRQTVLGVRTLVSRGATVVLHIVINGRNKDEFDGMLQDFRLLGVEMFQLTVIPPDEDMLRSWSQEEFLGFVRKAISAEGDIVLRNAFFSCIRTKARHDLSKSTPSFMKCLNCCVGMHCRGEPGRILSQDTSRHTVYFRDDDVSIFTPKLARLLDLFIQNKVPISLAVVPGRISKDCADRLLGLKQANPELLEIHQHGYLHENHGTIQAPYEFGPSRSIDEQRRDIFLGIGIMERLFKQDFVPMFTPPFHGFDENTVAVLHGTGYCISADRSVPGITSCPVALDFVESYSPLRNRPAKDIKDLYERLSKRNAPVGIVLHHELLSEEQFEFLGPFLEYLKDHADPVLMSRLAAPVLSN
jgi:MoaA/NifB/PqqE/SkfB family radical SAM enzyme